MWLAVSIERVHDLILEGLMRTVQKSKKPMDDWNAGASNGRLKRKKEAHTW
jgi:hypothetical protein